MSSAVAAGGCPPPNPPNGGDKKKLPADKVNFTQRAAQGAKVLAVMMVNILSRIRRAVSAYEDLDTVPGFQEVTFIYHHLHVNPRTRQPIPVDMYDLGNPHQQRIVSDWKRHMVEVKGMSNKKFGEARLNTLILGVSYEEIVKDMLLALEVPRSNQEWYVISKPYPVAVLDKNIVRSYTQRRNAGMYTPRSPRVFYDPYDPESMAAAIAEGLRDVPMSPNPNGMVRGIDMDGNEFEYVVRFRHEHILIAVNDPWLRLPAHLQGTCKGDHEGSVRYCNTEEEKIYLEFARWILMEDDRSLRQDRESSRRRMFERCFTKADPMNRDVDFRDLIGKAHDSGFLASCARGLQLSTRVFPEENTEHPRSMSPVENLQRAAEKFSLHYEFLKEYESIMGLIRKNQNKVFPPRGKSKSFDDGDKSKKSKKGEDKPRKSY